LLNKKKKLDVKGQKRLPKEGGGKGLGDESRTHANRKKNIVLGKRRGGHIAASRQCRSPIRGKRRGGARFGRTKRKKRKNLTYIEKKIPEIAVGSLLIAPQRREPWGCCGGGQRKTTLGVGEEFRYGGGP